MTGQVDGGELLRSYGWAAALIVAALLALALTVHRLQDPHRRRGLALWWRLRLRLHPGPGFAGRFALWRHYGRPAARAVAQRTRPSLGGAGLASWWARLWAWHGDIAVFIGWAQGWLWPARVYATLEDLVLAIAPPKEGKTPWLAGRILDAPGAVIATSIRDDLVELTAGLRSGRGRVHVFNPEQVGLYASTLRWSPVEGCEDPATAIRRAAHLVGATGTGGLTDAEFWEGQAAMVLAALLHAAAVGRQSMAELYGWVLADDPAPVKILTRRRDRHAERAAAIIGRYLAAHPRTRDSIAMTLRQALRAMEDPAAAWTLCPDPGEGLDLERFLRGRETLFLIASDDAHSAVAPVFAALVAELHHVAHVLGSRQPYGRMDPPVTFALDEVANICPVPLPQWLSTAAGSGMSMIVAGQSWSQFQDRWGERGARTVWNSAKAKVFFGATSDPDDLEVISKLCGEVTLPLWEESRDARGERHRTRRWDTVRVLPAEQARMLPGWRAVVIRRHAKPTIVRTERVWARADYKRWRAAGGQVPLPLLGEQATMPVEVAGRPTWDELSARRSVRASLAPARPRPARPWDSSANPTTPMPTGDQAGGPASAGSEA